MFLSNRRFFSPSKLPGLAVLNVDWIFLHTVMEYSKVHFFSYSVSLSCPRHCVCLSIVLSVKLPRKIKHTLLSFVILMYQGSNYCTNQCVWNYTWVWHWALGPHTVFKRRTVRIYQLWSFALMRRWHNKFCMPHKCLICLIEIILADQSNGTQTAGWDPLSK